MAKFISLQDHQKIMEFWKKHRQAPQGGYFSKLVAPPKLGKEGESRRQTEEYRIHFEEYRTTLSLTMNGEVLVLSSKLALNGVKAAAKQLSMLAYGNDREAKVIGERLKKALDEGGHDVVIRPHDRGVFLEEVPDEE